MGKTLAVALLSSAISSSPALAAVHGISLDGVSKMIAYGDPAGAPPPSSPLDDFQLRYGAVNFRYSSTGQVNNGWVTYYTTMYPSDQYNGPFEIRFTNATYENGDIGRGEDCPTLYWDIAYRMGNNPDGSLDNNQLQTWIAEQCSERPDATLYNSGARMGIVFYILDQAGNWFVASFNQVAPMDGAQYNVTFSWFTGDGTYTPYAKILVSKRNGSAGTLSDPDYFDSSYNYSDPHDGFTVQFSNLFWQLGCKTTDAHWADSCWTGLTAEFWLNPADDESILDMSPMATFMGAFLSTSGDNSAPFIGTFGQFPTLSPPEVYNTGNDTEFVVNSADRGYGVTEPQTSVSQAYTFDSADDNPNYVGLGAVIQASGQDF